MQTTPVEVLARASACTLYAAELAVTSQKLAHRRERLSAGTDSATEEGPGATERLAALEQAAKGHFSVWWLGSEWAFASWAIECLRQAELVIVGDAVAQARSAARLMSLWALHLEFNAYGDEGSVGDWRYDVSAWVGDGITVDHLRTLNAVDGLGWDFDDPDTEALLDEVCADVVTQYHREVADALLKELGDSLIFAYFWATRSEDVEYPLPGDLLHEILNDESVFVGDPHNKLPAFNWVQSGLPL